ncbi:hypothetical protein SAMN04488693_1198 [Arthrobacter subterraneus]|uniref:Ribbon-helix-helix protein CopG domain-containing protein n=1 Tax=Arthrobacter subterraneus TaxID=335973 RepID=A0A1G8MPG9_9MICC|nr:YfbU family protein [Arthrobacter subterraneus]SDI69782.1 hypothetical protein SAMN04488693_1198 [Arthrobacter subterraneus]
MATVTIRLDDELRDRIAEEAELRGVTMSNYIRDALENHIRFEQTDQLESGRPGSREGDIDLSPFQRRLLVQLHRAILAAKGDLSAEYYDAAEEARGVELLEHGFTGEYSEEFAGINPPMSQSECELVWDIFDMFRVIGSSVSALGKDGWTQLGVDERYGSFRGFDGNHSLENRLLSYAKYLVRNDRWEEQANVFEGHGGGNSHTQMVPTYRAMLRVFKPIWSLTVRSGSRWHLSVDELRQVLEAAPGARD